MSKNKASLEESGFITHETKPARAFVFVPLPGGADAVSDPAAKLAEAEGLAQAIHLNIIGAECLPLPQPHAATLFGKGRVEEIADRVKSEQADLVIIDHPLSPVQQRNLEKAWACKVIDRTALILEIFGERARSKEGVLQVDLAHLNYQKGRLVRSWTHLERQRGGSGFLGGPGETQIEADRRILQDKITRIKRELAKTVKTRSLHRARRQKAPYPTIALVGYTNAGKSTLFNLLTGADVMAENMLFATLDPTLRRIRLNKEGEAAGGQTLILSDTVGFISHLPTHLVAAFRGTLEEVAEADLILHVRDMANPDNAAHKRDVIEILRSLNIETENPHHLVEIWNKMDLLTPEQQLYLRNQAKTALLPSVAVSARTGQGAEELKALIMREIFGRQRKRTIRLEPQEFSLLDWLYRRGAQSAGDSAENGDIMLEASLPEAEWREFAALRRSLRDNREIEAEQH